MSVSYKSIRKRIKVLNGFEEDAWVPIDSVGLELWRMRNEHGETVNGYTLRRTRDWSEEEVKEMESEGRQAARRGDAETTASIAATFACGGATVWTLRLSALWKVDSVLRAIERGDEPTNPKDWNWIEMVNGEPAEFTMKETE